jgi:HD-like signal output (HDOD) protein
LTAKVLRLVNSGVFGLRRSCESISRAIVLLGSRQVAEIAVAQLALGQFDNTGELGRAIADHSQRVAGLCRKLAARRKQLRNVDVFTPGMLHDVGQLLMLQVDQGEYERLLRSVPAEADSLHELEMANFGYDHAVLAHHVMEQWRLPEMLRDVIRYHHDPAGIDPNNPTLREAVAVLRLANQISYVLLGDRNGERENLARLAATDEAALLELDATKLAQLWPDFVGVS